ncbi:MAG: DNA-binding protein [Patescibacteria group bacterium]|nr:DNA-binding protein [Patescibacteria group bacterium]
MSATKQIEAHLLSGKSISPLEALQEFGCFRLGSIINRLRKRYEIDTILVPNPKDPSHSFARYRMKKLPS